jgi:hypothetical protein
MKILAVLLLLAGCHHDPGKLVAVHAGVQVDAQMCHCAPICHRGHKTCSVKSCDGGG